MADMYFELDKEDFFTVLVPYGEDKKLAHPMDDSDNTGIKEDTKTPVRIDMLAPNDVIYDTYDHELIPTYGWIEKAHKFDGVKNESGLYEKGNPYVVEHGGAPFESVTLSALDLANLSVNYEPLDFMHKVRVISELHGIDSYYIIKRMKIPLGAPKNSVFEFGDKKRCMTDRMSSLAKKQANNENSLDNRIFILEN